MFDKIVTQEGGRRNKCICARGESVVREVVWLHGECRVETHSGRQRRPAKMRGRFPPDHPGWAPIISRLPHPSKRRIVCPPAVMNRRPAPRIRRIPIPAIVRPLPLAIVAIGLPIRDGLLDGWLPRPRRIRGLHPIPVWREIVIKTCGG